MTVKELRKLLEKEDQDAVVVTSDGQSTWELNARVFVRGTFDKLIGAFRPDSEPDSEKVLLDPREFDPSEAVRAVRI